jgi:hypothetical protein
LFSFFRVLPFSPQFKTPRVVLLFPVFRFRRTSACSSPRPSWTRRRCRWPCLFCFEVFCCFFEVCQKKVSRAQGRGRSATGKASFEEFLNSCGIGLKNLAPCFPLLPWPLSLSVSLFSRRAAARDHALYKQTNFAPKAPARGALATSSTSPAPRTTATNSMTGASSAEPSSGLSVTRTSAPSEAVTVATFPETSLTLGDLI